VGSLLIIITSLKREKYLWGKVACWDSVAELKDKDKVGEVRCRRIGDNLVVIFCHPNGATEMVTTVGEHYADFQEVYIAAHRGSVDWESVRKKLGNRLQGLDDFDHQDRRGPDQVYDALFDLVKNPTPETFNAAIEEIKKKRPLDLAKRLTILKHRIAHLFLPIDIDLQGLIETGFREDYWEEVVQAYRHGKAMARFQKARELIYGVLQDQDTVEKVVKEARDNLQDKPKKIETAWEEVQKLLPKENGPSKHPDVTQILEALGCQNMENVKAKCKAFHQWFAALDSALDELRKVLPGQEGQV